MTKIYYVCKNCEHSETKAFKICSCCGGTDILKAKLTLYPYRDMSTPKAGEIAKQKGGIFSGVYEAFYIFEPIK